MKKLSTVLLATFAVFCSVSAQAQIFYKISKPGTEKSSYILGTHHFANLGVVDSIPGLGDAMNDADKLIGEIDMSMMKDPIAMMGMQKMLVAPPDSTLDKLLTPAQLDSLNTVWNELTGGAAPLQMLYSMKPAVLSTQISALMSQKVFPDLNPLEGIDMTMQERARMLGKTVEGFETMEFQMDILYNTSVAEQAENLLETVRDLPGIEEKSIALSEAYKSHDIARILEVMKDEMQAETAERMIYGRNDAWVKQLLQMLPTESILVVVGAGHLPGERGVLEGLRKAGYEITPIN